MPISNCVSLTADTTSKPSDTISIAASNRPEFRGIHAQFLADDSSEIDLEGARFSGKTWVCCAKIVLSCLKWPGIRWLACRYSNEETQTKIRPVFRDMCQRFGVSVEWNDDEKHFAFPTVGGHTSRVFCHGLKSIRREEELAKVRGLEMGGIWNDQSEETPEGTAQELPFGTRQPGYPRQVIYSPNPPNEDHFLTDWFPEECSPDNPQKPFAHRNYYRLSLYDNAHNLPHGKIKELEDAFPPTHAKHKSLILGMRGPNVVGDAVYEHVFMRQTHYLDVKREGAVIYEAIEAGRHHPVYMAMQRTPYGGMHGLGGIMGKRMFLEDFLPIAQHYRSEWFEDAVFKTCCDPPPSIEAAGLRYTHISTLREFGFSPKWRPNANAPDVRETVIQHNAALMRRRAGLLPAFAITADPSRWLMVSASGTKQSRHFLDGCETSYVWDRNLVSVSNRKVRQPMADPWIDGWQRCFENIALNFSAGLPTQMEMDADAKRRRQDGSDAPLPSFGEHGWMAI